MKKKKPMNVDAFGQVIYEGDVVLLPGKFIAKVNSFGMDQLVALINTTCGTIYSSNTLLNSMNKKESNIACYEVIKMDSNLKVFVDEDTTFGELINKKEDEEIPTILPEYDITEKFAPLIENDFQYLKKYLMNILVETSRNNKKADLRYKHCELVAKISKDILDIYIKDIYENPKKYLETSISTYSLIKTINKYGLEWTVEMIAYFHDMFKYSQSKKLEHGKIAAKQFSMFCKMYDVDMWDIPMKMKEALSLHSDKSKVLYSNPFFSILCDADVLSKYTLSALYEKIERNDWINDLDNALDYTNEVLKKYVPKTPFFDDLRALYVSKLVHEVTALQNYKEEE